MFGEGMTVAEPSGSSARTASVAISLPIQVWRGQMSARRMQPNSDDRFAQSSSPSHIDDLPPGQVRKNTRLEQSIQ